MSKQIAAIDRAIMNELYSKEYTLLSGCAALVMRRRGRHYVGEIAEAFEDHGEYIDTLLDICRDFTDWEFDEQ